tara:strand:- start:465 stop:695 length:231 start_codon:yes stop_codon:yes gene_type:complete
MSFNVVVTKLIDSMTEEIRKEDNIVKIKEDILKPIVEQLFYLMYPYFAGISLILIIVILVIFIILFLNIKIYYHKN